MSSDHLDNESFTDFEKSCPLCMELFDLDDMGFLPCPCGYRICRFCWHRLKTYEDNIEAGFEDQDGSSQGRCPACRQVYSDVPAGFDCSNLTAMLDSNKYKKKKKRLQNKQKQKLQEEKQKLKEILKRDEKSLAGLRVVQKNLVFVIGIQQRNHDELRREFSKFGKIHKLVIGNTNNTNLNTAYVTYTRPEDAIKAIQTLNHGTTSLNSQLILNGQSKLMNKTTSTRPTQGIILKASLGTTKYCNHWLKNQQCPKLPDCMYLHELAEPDASFTKEDMQKGKHAEYEKKLIQEYLDKNSDKNPLNTDCDSIITDDNNLKNSNSSSSIDNLANSENEQLNDQLNHQMNNINDEEDNLIFSNNLGRKFCTTTSSSTIHTVSKLSNVKQINFNIIKTNDKPIVTDNGDLNDNDEDSNEDNKISSNNMNNLTTANHQLFNRGFKQQTPEINELNNKKFNKNLCINSSSYIDDAQQLLKIDDSHNSITVSNNNPVNNSITNSKLQQLLNLNSNSSNCINIDNSRNNNRLRTVNLIDEIIANSSDSSTSYSTCSSGSNRLNTSELNEFNNLLLNGEHLSSLNLAENSNKHSPTINNHNYQINQINNNLLEDEDGLDFDPISISTIGLQDLLKTSTMNTTTNLLNQNQISTTTRVLNNQSITNNLTTTNSLNNFLFGQQQPQLSQQLNQLNFLTNGVLHNHLSQSKPNPPAHQLNQQQLSSLDRSNLFGNSLFANNSINNHLGSTTNSMTSNNLQHQAQQPTTINSSDNLRNSLRALLPNVNIKFANSSNSIPPQNQNNNMGQTVGSSNIGGNLNQNQLNLSNPQNILFKQQQKLSQQQQMKHNLSNLTNFSVTQPNSPIIKPQSQQQNFVNQSTIYPPLAFLQQQQLLRQQQAAGLNLQFSNVNFFNQQQIKTPNQISPANPSQQPQLQHINNLQRFFQQGFAGSIPISTADHQAVQPPPGFLNSMNSN